MAAELRVGALVVVGGRNRNGLPGLIGVETEIPHAGQIPDTAGRIGLRIHIHYLSLFALKTSLCETDSPDTGGRWHVAPEGGTVAEGRRKRTLR